MTQITFSHFRWWPFLLAAGPLLTTSALATWQDDIGYTRLVQELGPALPKGAGVSVTLVEGTLTAEGGEYLPSTDQAPASGNFAGKFFNFQSGVSPVSFHAARAGSFFFGANTNALAGDASVAPLAGTAPTATVDCYEADRWLGPDFLRMGGLQLPRHESPAVGNHSWIGAVGPNFSADDATEALQRLDWAVHTDDFVAVVGLNNGAGTAVPPLLGSAYNVLSVGRTDGLHSTGTSAADVDGPGRVKPELVAPMVATSWSTAVVSSCAAMLGEAGAAISPQAHRSEVVRAVLLAGARKDPFPGWANSRTRPLDPHFGAGEVNLWRSHHTLVAGEIADGGSTPVGRSGWHYASGISPGQERAYALVVPEGCTAREVSVALVWNRIINTTVPTLWTSPSPQLPNLDLEVHTTPTTGRGVEVAVSESGAHGSVPHPLEYVHVRDAPAGLYTLRVHNAATSTATGYGLAWFISLAPAAPPEVTSSWSADAQGLTLTFSHLGVGLTYALEKSADLISWETDQIVMPATTTAVVTVNSEPAPAFYRLVWVP